MKITKIIINNYRLLNNLEIDLEKELSLIIGKNNCGKTSVLSILSKFIGDKSSSNNFRYDDFNLDFKNLLYEKTEGNLDDWDDNSKKGIELYLYINYDSDDNLSNISSLILDLDPDNKTIVLKFEYTLDQEGMETLITSFMQYYARYSSEENGCIDKKVCFNNFM